MKDKDMDNLAFRSLVFVALLANLDIEEMNLILLSGGFEIFEDPFEFTSCKMELHPSLSKQMEIAAATIFHRGVDFEIITQGGKIGESNTND